MDTAQSTNTSPTASAAEVIRTKILLTGLRKYGNQVPLPDQQLIALCRCGKTSILEVLFNAFPPKDAFFIEPTTKVVKTAYESVGSPANSARMLTMDQSSTVIPLEIWDCPGSLTIQTLPTPLSQFPTIVFVIDIQVRFYCSFWYDADPGVNRTTTSNQSHVWWNSLSPLIRRIRM
jgi:Ras-related GTP-binding protein C/D